MQQPPFFRKTIVKKPIQWYTGVGLVSIGGSFMCTAVSWKSKCHYFGRNLDLEYSYQESVIVTPRHYPFRFRMMPHADHHYAMIGIATVAEDYPLYYDAVNEKGLCIAGLNFPDLAYYEAPLTGRDNVASFELIPWILGRCATVDQAEALLRNANITGIAFSDAFRPTPLHWIIADSVRCVTVEAMKDGVRIHENPVGILTNNPPFDFHMYYLKNYMQVSTAPATNLFARNLELKPYSNGMGAMGLPGDFSSASRFVRAAFVKLNSVASETEESSVSQFFHILDAVAMPCGCVQMPDGRYEITRYSSCCNADRGIYYYKTYHNSRVCSVDMHRENLNGHALISYPLLDRPDFFLQNHGI